jgi:hypothetical protein
MVQNAGFPGGSGSKILPAFLKAERGESSGSQSDRPRSIAWPEKKTIHR